MTIEEALSTVRRYTIIAARFRELIEGYSHTFMDISATKKSQ